MHFCSRRYSKLTTIVHPKLDIGVLIDKSKAKILHNLFRCPSARVSGTPQVLDIDHRIISILALTYYLGLRFISLWALWVDV